MDEFLDISILDSGSPSRAVALARTRNDMAVATLRCGKQLTDLASFRRVIERALRGQDRRPSRQDLARYGLDLFGFVIRDDIRTLYDRLPATHVGIRLFSDRPDLQEIPWEYLQEPRQPPGPRLERSVVRTVATIGYQSPEPAALRDRVRVLFVSADPPDQDPVSWPESKAIIERTFATQIPGTFDLKAVEGASPQALIEALQAYPCEILHFSGHGRVGEHQPAKNETECQPDQRGPCHPHAYRIHADRLNSLATNEEVLIAPPGPGLEGHARTSV
jgi:hypothetical protein